MTETYHVSGTLEKDISIGNIERYDRRSIYREVDAENAQDAINSFEMDGWEWIETPTVWIVTEAMKMERPGQLSLFPLDEAIGYYNDEIY